MVEPIGDEKGAGSSVLLRGVEEYCLRMNGEFYTTQQAAEVLGVAPDMVRQLIAEDKLEAHRHEETGRWLITTRSVHARLEELPPEPPEARDPQVSTQEENPAGFWILVLIAVITLLAAGYTLLTVLSGANV